MLTSTALTFGSLAALASGSALDALNNAFAKREFQFPATVPLAKRAVTGAAYQCHANCGYTILNAKEDGYCDNSEWKELLSACLACANEYDLWPDYGSGVEAAAKGCGLSAVPSGSSGSASTTAAAAETTAAAQTTAAAPSTSAAGTKAEETKAAETTTVSAAKTTATGETKAEETAVASSTVVVVTSAAAGTPTGSNSTSSTPTSSVVTGGAPEFAFSNVLAVGVALVAVAGLM